MNKTTKKDAVNWFEIYVADFDRAKRFYETALQTRLEGAEMEGCRISG